MTSKSVLHALYSVKKCHVPALRAFRGKEEADKFAAESTETKNITNVSLRQLKHWEYNK